MSNHAAVPFLRRKSTVAAGAVGAVVALGAGVTLSDVFAATPAAKAAPKVTLPTANATFDYQIGGPYTPAKGVTAVSRDRSAKPATGLYNICYVNAFQAQPDALSWWQKNNPLNRVNRVKMLMPAVGLMFFIEKDLATLGIDVFDFGGTLTRKVNTLSERVGFFGPVKGETLMPVLNNLFNAYCRATRPGFTHKDFMAAETTAGAEELALEQEIFGSAATA